MAATIGLADDGTPVEIGDTARRSGLYILGGPGMGKTQLIINLILSDIRSGHGVFFLDPHGDAIDQVLDRLPTGRATSDIILLNPADKTHTFGINVLRCDPSDIEERNEAYARAYGIFERLWRDEMGPWLQLILSNTLPVFIENQGYTLADMPLFLQNKEFRARLLSNVRYNTQPLDFWKKAFSTSRDTDQQAKVDAALTRLYILLTKEYVRHVISQPKTTLDFSAAMRDKKIILLDLPAHLPEDDKRFIGTIVISELLHATRSRQKLPQSERGQFCVFVDEFQNFATSRDFGILITEGRKFGIATTIAHQERFGQLSDDKKIQGATAVVANKIIFQTTVNDSRELAPEFAKEPPFEIRKERELVVSQSPVSSLLAGHANPEMRWFVDAYLRHLDEKQVDAKEEIGRVRILREAARDGISSGRLTAQLDRLNREKDRGAGALSLAVGSANQAESLTAQMLDLFDTASSLRMTIRELDKLFIAIMEGHINPDGGDEKFSSFLIERVRLTNRVPAELRPVLETYINLSFGNPSLARQIPFDLAKTCVLEQERVNRIEADAMASVLQKRQQLCEETRRAMWSSFLRYRERRKELELEETQREAAEGHLGVWKLPRRVLTNTPLQKRYGLSIRGRARTAYMNCAFRDSISPGATAVEISRVGPILRSSFRAKINRPVIEDACRIYCYVAWLESIPDLKACLSPYLSAHFDSYWHKTIEQTDELIKQLCEPYKVKEKVAGGFKALNYVNYILPAFAGRVERFLWEHKEGAFVVFAMIQAATIVFYSARVSSDDRRYSEAVVNPYEYNNAARIPYLRDREPVETFRAVIAAAKAISAATRMTTGNIPTQVFKCFKLKEGWDWGLSDATKAGLRLECVPSTRDVSSRDDVKFVKELVAKKWGGREASVLQQFIKSRAIPCGEYEGAARTWGEIDDFTRSYVAGRACDIIAFGQNIADTSFPRPGFRGGEELVQALASQIVKYEEELIKKKEDEEETEAGEKIERECKKAMDNIAITLPALLEPEVLSDERRHVIIEACERYLNSKNMGAAILVIGHFVRFCRDLKRPENHILVPSGQYVEKRVQTRTVADMNSEMAQELASLPRFSAYAKIHRERGGGQEVVKVRVQTVGGGKPLIPDLSRGPRLLE